MGNTKWPCIFDSRVWVNEHVIRVIILYDLLFVNFHYLSISVFKKLSLNFVYISPDIINDTWK